MAVRAILDDAGVLHEIGTNLLINRYFVCLRVLELAGNVLLFNVDLA